MAGHGQDREGLLDRLVAEYADRRGRGEDPGREEVLAAHPELRASLGRLFDMVDAGEGGDGAEAPPRFPEGTRLGGFRVLREIGRGGMGEVYLAEDTRLGRRVALKVLPAAFTSSRQVQARFQREAALASGLDHPGICPVYETGEEDGVAFMAMRYVEGDTLASWIARSRAALAAAGRTSGCVTGFPGPGGPSGAAAAGADVPRVLRLVETVARALHAAHESGLVHRDVKPGNIMVARDGEPVLLDFGLARAEDEGTDALTRTGALLGTPSYMSPEQLAAQRIRLDRRTDVYSLGVALYECLTLRVPFEAPTLDALYHRILAAEPEDPRRLNPALSADLRVVVATALEKDRDRRYRTALALAEDLRRVRESEPILARPAGPVLRLRRWAQRNPAVAASATVAFLALAGGLGVSLDLLDATRRERDAKEGALVVVGRERDARERALRENREILRHVRAAALVSASREAEEEDGTRAFLLAREALRAADVGAAVSRLLEAAQAPLRRAVLEGHGDVVNSAVFSPDGTRVLTSSFDGTARLWDLDGREVAVFRGHTGVLQFAALSPDGRRILTGGEDGTVRLWDPDGRPLAVLRGHRGFVRTGVFSPDGTRILTAGLGDGTARIWDREGREQSVLRGHGIVNGAGLESAAFSPDGTRVVTAGWDATARIWDGDGRELAVLRGHEPKPCGGVTTASFSPDGTGVVTGGGDGTVRVWDLEGNERTVLRGHESMQSGGVRTATFSPDGRSVLTGGADGTARLWETDGRTIAVLPVQAALQSGGLWTAAFSRDGRTLLTAGSDGKARLWTGCGAWSRGEVRAAVMAAHPSLMTGGIRAASFSPDGTRVVTAGADGRACLWDLAGEEVIVLGTGPEGGKEPRFTVHSPDGALVLIARGAEAGLWDAAGRPRAVLQGHEGDLRSAEFSPDGTRILTTSTDGTVRLWTAAGDATAVFRGATYPLESAFLSGDGNRILTSSTFGTAVVRDAAGREIAVLRGHDARIFAARFSPGGDRVLTASGDGTARLWDLAGRLVALFPGDAVEIGSFEFSPDGERILGMSRDGSVRLWDRDGRPIGEFRGDGGKIGSAIFSPDGGRILTRGEDGTVRLWSSAGAPVAAIRDDGESPPWAIFAPDGSLVLTVGSHEARLWNLDGTPRPGVLSHEGRRFQATFSADGARILTAGADRTARLWDREGREVAILRGHGDTVTSAVLTRDGSRVITTSEDGTVRSWLVRARELLETADARVTREFTSGERLKYADILAPSTRTDR